MLLLDMYNLSSYAFKCFEQVASMKRNNPKSSLRGSLRFLRLLTHNFSVEENGKSNDKRG